MTFISPPLWQIEEYLNLPFLLLRAQWANENQEEVTCTRVDFGSHPQQHVLICLPIHLDRWQRTAVYFLPGGGWRIGNPNLFRFIGYFFARLGYPTIIGGYRLAPAFKFPRQLEDACQGLDAGLKDMKCRGLSIEKVILGGQSTGAQLSSLLAYDRNESIRQYLSQGDIAGLLLISGPLNFHLCSERGISKLITGYIDSQAAWEQADPIRHVKGDEDIPILCIHGQKDPLVNVQNAFTFAAQVKPGLSKIQVVMGAHHYDLIKLFCTKDHPVAQWIVDWLQHSIHNKALQEQTGLSSRLE